MVERHGVTVQYSGETPPAPEQLAAAQGQAVEGGSVVVSEDNHRVGIAPVSRHIKPPYWLVFTGPEGRKEASWLVWRKV